MSKKYKFLRNFGNILEKSEKIWSDVEIILIK